MFSSMDPMSGLPTPGGSHEPGDKMMELTLSEIDQVVSGEPESVLNNLWPDRVPLFRHTNLVVDMKVASGGRKILCRDLGMEDMLGSAAIRLRDDLDGIQPKYLSIFYLMLSDAPDPCFYVGICRRWGKSHAISANIRGVSPRWRGLSQFARWGDGKYWHIGELSDALFADGPRHLDWADSLFVAHGVPSLKRDVRFSCFLVRNEGELTVNVVPDSALNKRVTHVERLLIQLLQQMGVRPLNVHGT